VKSIIGDLPITEKQGWKLHLENYRQISPSLEKRIIDIELSIIVTIKKRKFVPLALVQ
jgi:hypothetical protein